MKQNVHRSSFKIIASIILGCISLWVLWWELFAYDYTYYFNQYNIEVLTSKTVETDYPSRAKPNPKQDKKDLSYWVNDVLPYAEGKNADIYLVYPTHGIVIPVLEPNENDLKLIQEWKDFNHFKYLEKGGLHHFWGNPTIEKTNIVVAAHSSYTKTAPWTYKTVWQVFIISRPGESVFLYIKNSAWSYDLLEYTITDSYETDKYNVSILPYKNDGNSYLTTYACYKIGSNEDRRVNEAILKEIFPNHSRIEKSPEKSLKTSTTIETQATQKAHASAPEKWEILNNTATNIAISKIGSKQFRRKVKTLSAVPPQPVPTTYTWVNVPSEFVKAHWKKLDRMAFMIMYRNKFLRPLIKNVLKTFENKAKYERNSHKQLMYTYISRKLSQYISDSGE